MFDKWTSLRDNDRELDAREGVPDMAHMIRLYARHYQHLCYHMLHRYGVPSHNIPDTFLGIAALALTAYILVLAAVGRQAYRKGQSFWYGFLFALFSTPVLASLYVAFLRPVKVNRKVSRGRTSLGPVNRARERERIA